MRSNSFKAVLAGLPPLLVYVSTASGYGYWFDSGEFVAVAADFGVSHPPGHPLAAIVLGAANWLPVGALAFRVAVICGVLGAIAAIALCFALEHTLSASAVVRQNLRYPLALAATWWVVGSHAWWFQSVRPEVYSLQAALMCIAAERLLRGALADFADVRPLYQSALAFGLAMANHHYLAALGFLPAAWLLWGVWRRWGWRPFAWSGAFVGAGLLTYVYLPIRASAAPFLNLGDPSSFGRFFWVITAKAFQKSVAPHAVAPFGERFADVLVVTAEDLHVVSLALALLGVYFMLRVRPARKLALFWLTLWAAYALGRAAIGFIRGNPDAVAYFMLSYASLAAFGAFAVGVLLSALAEAAPARPKLTPAVAGALALAASLQLVRSWPRSSLAHFVDTDVFDDGLRRSLPLGSVVLAHNPQTIFRFWGGEAEERNRPDVTLVPLPLLTYPKLVDRLVTDQPELKPLLRDYVLEGALSAADLQSLANARPVYVEMDIRVEPEMMELLVPDQLYHRVLTAEAAAFDEVAAIRAHSKLWADVYRRIGHPIDEYTEAQLLWRHYADSLYFAAIGATDAALGTVDAGLALNPHAQELVMLQRALKQAPPGERIDIRPFVVH